MVLLELPRNKLINLSLVSRVDNNVKLRLIGQKNAINNNLYFKELLTASLASA